MRSLCSIHLAAALDGGPEDNQHCPEHNAAPDQVVLDSDEVTLDGSESYDPDGTIVSYEWVLHHRETSADTFADGANPVVSGLELGFYEVELTVTDDDELTDTNTMLLAAGPCQGWPEPNADLNIKKLETKEGKNDAKLKVDGSIALLELSVSDGDIVESRTTIEIFGILIDGGDFVISSEDTLEVKYKKYLEIKK